MIAASTGRNQLQRKREKTAHGQTFHAPFFLLPFLLFLPFGEHCLDLPVAADGPAKARACENRRAHTAKNIFQKLYLTIDLIKK